MSARSHYASLDRFLHSIFLNPSSSQQSVFMNSGRLRAFRWRCYPNNTSPVEFQFVLILVQIPRDDILRLPDRFGGPISALSLESARSILRLIWKPRQAVARYP